MATTPEELLQAAETFVDANTEVDWRNAAYCGYYAAFHKCIPFAYGERVATPGHAELIDMLTKPRSSTPHRRAGVKQGEATRLESTAKIERLDTRLRVVERDVSGIQARLRIRRPVTQGASPSDLEDDADA